MLEVYTCHKVKELGQFDDVISGLEIGGLEIGGLEIGGEDTGLHSGFDCILTKGLSTLFVECRSGADARICKSEFADFAKRCGINAQAVLVSEAQTAPSQDPDVITVWKQSEIDAIGETLLEIINGEYTPIKE